MNYIRSVSGDVLDYDARMFESEMAIYDKNVKDYFNLSKEKEKIYKAIHIEKSTQDPKYIMENDEVAKALDGEINEDFTEYYSFILEHGLKVLVYVGEFDMRDGPVI